VMHQENVFLLNKANYARTIITVIKRSGTFISTECILDKQPG